MYGILEELFTVFIEYSILILEIIGAIIILIAAVKGFMALIQKRGSCRYIVNNGISLALTFLLCGEALKTIVAPDWKAIGMTGAILVMRAAMGLLIHWENKHESKPEH